jgi:hypothetical protein
MLTQRCPAAIPANPQQDRQHYGRAGAKNRLLKPTWRHVSTEIAKAAEGEKDLLEVCVSLRLVLALEGVDCLLVK